eukprot:8908219-Lingulodinium_polyedra.AAC.1
MWICATSSPKRPRTTRNTAHQMRTRLCSPALPACAQKLQRKHARESTSEFVEMFLQSVKA